MDKITTVKQNSIVNLWLTIISSFLIVTPYFNRNFPVSIWCGIIALWYFDVLLHKHGQSSINSTVAILLLWFGWCFALRLIGYSSAAWGNYFLLLSSIDIIVKSLYICKYYTLKEKEYVLRSIQVFMLITLIMNILTWVRDSSEFSNFNFYVSKYQTTNKIQSAQFYNMLAFLIGDSLFLFSRDENKNYKLLDLALVILGSFFILFINPRMNALLLTIILSILIILFIEPGSGKNIIFYGLIAIILTIMLALNKDVLIDLVGPRLKPRIESIYNLLSGRDYDVEGSSMGRRIELQLISLRTFMSSPRTFVIGAGLHLGSDYYTLIGQHGFISDTLAEYGMIGIAFLLFFFTSLYKQFKVMYNETILKNAIKSVLITFFIASFICNPFCKEVCISAFLLPSLFYEVKSDKEN